MLRFFESGAYSEAAPILVFSFGNDKVLRISVGNKLCLCAEMFHKGVSSTNCHLEKRNIEMLCPKLNIN